jgi:4-amino-4-deoxy-L-arabinose transferase-like glycosyltransferase
VPAWVLLELVPTKLPHYVLPLYPALALLCGAALRDALRSWESLWVRRAAILVKLLWAAVSVALAAVLIVLPLRFGGQLGAPSILGAAALLILTGWFLRYRPGTAGACAVAVCLTLAFTTTATWGVLPELDRLWLSRSAVEMVAQHPPSTGTPLVAVGYAEPSLIFLFGTNLQIATPRNAVEAIAQGGEALVSSREDAIFRQAAGANGLVAQPIASARGIDYSNGQHIVLTLYRLAPG